MIQNKRNKEIHQISLNKKVVPKEKIRIILKIRQVKVNPEFIKILLKL